MAQSDVDALSLAMAAMAGPYPMIDALTGGTSTMRAGSKKFLPQWPKEDEISYKARLDTATLFPAFSRTAGVLAAKPFARPLSVDGTIPAQVTELMSDVDMFGTDLQPYAADLLQTAMEYGLCGVLVDVPQADGIRTAAEEKAAGVRPYLTKYPPGTILGWRSDRDTNGTHLPLPGLLANGSNLTMLRLLEHVTEPDGEWGEKIVTQVRVLYPGRWEIWRKTQGTQIAVTWVKVSQGATSLQKIPFVFFYGLRKAFGIGESPLLELAYLNVEHWQSSSDQQTILHVARVPVLFAKGFEEGDTITIGAASACRSSSPDAELSYVEHTGAAIEAGRQSIQDLEDRMRQIGAELLVQQPATATATQITTESEGNRSTMQMIVEGFEESLEDCVRLMSEWMGLAADPEITLFKDFGAANLSEKGGDLLLRAAGDDHVSSETVFDALKRADVVPPGLDWETEQLRLAKQPRGAPPKRDHASEAGP